MYSLFFSRASLSFCLQTGSIDANVLRYARSFPQRKRRKIRVQR